jgi:uncharacterized protein YndB with AHSA1/START domain
VDSQEEASVNSTTQIHQIYIRATAEAIWDAITQPEWSARYGYRALSEYELKPGGRYRVKANAEMLSMGLPEVILDGEVVEARPPRKLVHTLRFLFSKENEAEGFTRITWEIEPTGQGFCRLTVTHDVKGAPLMAHATSSPFSEQGGGGWTWVISDLKSLLESGKPLAD